MTLWNKATEYELKNCRYCDGEFWTSVESNIYCSTICKSRWHNENNRALIKKGRELEKATG